ncbi:MAG: CHAD domain-containing protein [Acidobacteria bacterium]|nr:CHAD domain-containing protein [Acidobacteriota bacterium]
MAKGWEIEGLKPELPIYESARLIITTKFREAFSYQSLVKTSEDIEVIHDMRVSLRRLWAAMTSFAHYFVHNKKFSHLSTHTRKLARKLGSVRDLDVLIELLEKRLEEAKDQPLVVLAINYITSNSQTKRLQHRAKLFDYMEKLSQKEFERKFLAFFDSVNLEKPRVKHKKNHLIFLNSVKNFYEQDPKGNFHSEVLHEFRIAAKKLRYSLEFFEMCFNKSLGEQLKSLRQIQELLGDLHDCDVMVELLKEYRKKIDRKNQQELFLGLKDLGNYFKQKREANLLLFKELWQIDFQNNFRLSLEEILSPVQEK